MADNSSIRKTFIVEEPATKKRVFLLYRSYEDFIQKCKDKFSIPDDEEVILEFAEYNAEVDKDSIETLEDKTLLVLRRVNEMSCSATPEQPSQGEVPGSTAIHRRNMDTQQEGDVPGSTVIYRRNMDTKQKDTLAVVRYPAKIPNYGQLMDLFYEHTVASNMSRENLLPLFENTLKLSEEKANTLIALYDKDKGKALERIKTSLDGLNLMPLHIAVIGSSGNGKSTIINAMREVRDKTQKVAVGTIETTKECTPCPHPKHPNIVFWDIPGVGTSSFLRDRYFSKIKVDRYEFFLVCSCSRFTEDDKWLVDEIRKRSKRFYFLRTKTDIDIQNAKFDKGDDFNQEEEIHTIRDYYKTGLPEGTPLFLVSSRKPLKFDFPALMERLIKDAPYEKAHAVLMGLVVTNKKHIEQKAEYLRANILNIMFWPQCEVPIFLQMLQYENIVSTMSSYKEELHLRDEDICRFASLCGLSVKELKKEANLELATKASEQSFLTDISAAGNSLSSKNNSFNVARYLGKLLNTHESNALKLIDFVVKKHLNLL